MRLLKREKDALASLLEQGAATPEDLVDIVVKAIDDLRGERVYSYGLVKHLAGFEILGPFATAGQATKAVQKHPAVVQGWALSGRTAEGLNHLIAELDKPAKPSGDFEQTADDARLFRLGWDGKRSTRKNFE